MIMMASLALHFYAFEAISASIAWNPGYPAPTEVSSAIDSVSVKLTKRTVTVSHRGASQSSHSHDPTLQDSSTEAITTTSTAATPHSPPIDRPFQPPPSLHSTASSPTNTARKKRHRPRATTIPTLYSKGSKSPNLQSNHSNKAPEDISYAIHSLHPYPHHHTYLSKPNTERKKEKIAGEPIPTTLPPLFFPQP